MYAWIDECIDECMDGSTHDGLRERIANHELIDRLINQRPEAPILRVGETQMDESRN